MRSFIAARKRLPKSRALLGQVLVLDHFEGGHGHSASDRVAAKGGAVLTGMDDAHDRVVGEDRAHRVDAP